MNPLRNSLWSPVTLAATLSPTPLCGHLSHGALQGSRARGRGEPARGAPAGEAGEPPRGPHHGSRLPGPRGPAPTAGNPHDRASTAAGATQSRWLPRWRHLGAHGPAHRPLLISPSLSRLQTPCLRSQPDRAWWRSPIVPCSAVTRRVRIPGCGVWLASPARGGPSPRGVRLRRG